MATHRQLPNNTDIAPFQEKGRWYRAFIEKDESGNSKLTYADSGLPTINPAGYGFTMDGQKDGKNFHLISVSCNPDVGTGTAGDPAFFYPTIGQNYTADGSQYVVDFNKPETNVSLKINDTSATVTEQVNGLVQKNIDITATVESGESGTVPGMYFLYNSSGTYVDLETSLSSIMGSSTWNTYGVTAGTYYITEIDLYLTGTGAVGLYPTNALGLTDSTYIFAGVRPSGGSGSFNNDCYTLSISFTTGGVQLNTVNLYSIYISGTGDNQSIGHDVYTDRRQYIRGYKIYYTKLVNNDEL